MLHVFHLWHDFTIHTYIHTCHSQVQNMTVIIHTYVHTYVCAALLNLQ